MENRKKEDSKQDFLNVIFNSWTWEKLTKQEKERFIETISNDGRLAIGGTYQQRFNAYNSMYYAYLMALDYKPIGWRDDVIKL